MAQAVGCFLHLPRRQQRYLSNPGYQVWRQSHAVMCFLKECRRQPRLFGPGPYLPSCCMDWHEPMSYVWAPTNCQSYYCSLTQRSVQAAAAPGAVDQVGSLLSECQGRHKPLEALCVPC